MWKPLKQEPKAVARRFGGMLVATRLFITGSAAPSPKPTQVRAARTAGTDKPAAATWITYMYHLQ